MGRQVLNENEDPRMVAAQSLSDDFRQMSRNGRWGTCAGCPCDAQGHAYPEFCVFTQRYDHQLDAYALAERFTRAVSNEEARVLEIRRYRAREHPDLTT